MIARLKHALRYPYARLNLGLQSERARLRALWQKTLVHHEAPYAGQRILLLALYEKGELRPDVLRLLAAAKDAGLYVLAVNTLKLRKPEALRDLIDCYIERPNFGRDFGSYKTGFMHFYARGWDAGCPRLLMLNDSIYFTVERLPAFIDDMMSSSTEVLGSTENFEVEHHLGSFCIAMGAPVLRHRRFRRFWRRYKLSDIRPAVIRRGEMGLTKALKRSVSSSAQFRALYGAARFAEAVSRDSNLLDYAISNSRRSDLMHWKRTTPVAVVSHVLQRFTIPRRELQGAEVKFEATNEDVDARVWVTSVSDVERVVQDKVAGRNSIDGGLVRKALAAFAGEIFMVGSQIHQNGVLLLHMGLPLIKLDVLYRGVFALEDVNLACEHIREQEAEELRQLLVERPFGGHMLFGWKRAAFERGLI